MENWGYPFEDHGDPSVDERWRRVLTREDALSDMETGGIDVRTPVASALDPLVSVDELLADIQRRGA